MDGYEKSSHAVYRCEYHFIWVPKYRYQVLVQEIKSRLKEILVELCEWLDAHVFVCSTETFSREGYADIEGEEC